MVAFHIGVVVTHSGSDLHRLQGIIWHDSTYFSGVFRVLLPGAYRRTTCIDPLFDDVAIPANQHAKPHGRGHAFGVAETIDMA